MIENSQENIENDRFNILLGNYEGPIDLLLELAKKQKVNLSDISILELANQYIKFIDKYNKIHLEIAADYLVMAAWLTYLKSRLLLPKNEEEENHTPEELEEALKFQLQRLEAIQNVSKILYSKPIIDRDIFYGGSEEGLQVKYNITYTSTLYDVLKSYSNILVKNKQASNLKITSSEIFSVDQALQRLKSMFGSIQEWTNFYNLIPQFGMNKVVNKSYITSSFVASLELVKNGFVEVQQKETFGNIFIKSK